MDRTPTLLLAALAALGAACSDDAPAEGEGALVARGKQIYGNVCIACHNANPNLDGTTGPAVAGSSRELIEARVVQGRYPPGYEPKRGGNVMPAFAYLAPEVDALTAYLAEAAKSK